MGGSQQSKRNCSITVCTICRIGRTLVTSGITFNTSFRECFIIIPNNWALALAIRVQNPQRCSCAGLACIRAITCVAGIGALEAYF